MHNGINTDSHTGLVGDVVSIDDIEFQVFLNDAGLNFDGKMIPYFIFSIHTVEKKDTAGFGVFKHVIFLKEGELMTSYKVRFVITNQIWILDRSGTKTKM